jgi:hypothetical protein
MTGKEVIEILEKEKKKHKIDEKESITVGRETLPATWNRISDFVNDFYLYKYTKKIEFGDSVPYYYDPKYTKVTGISYKKNRKCIYIYTEINYETYTWSYSGRVYLDDFINENYKKEILEDLKEKTVFRLNKKIEKLMTELGKCCEELEKIEG